MPGGAAGRARENGMLGAVPQSGSREGTRRRPSASQSGGARALRQGASPQGLEDQFWPTGGASPGGLRWLQGQQG